MAPHKHSINGLDGRDTKIFWAVFVNLTLTVVQIIGGILSGSLALIADAIHNLSDAMSLIIAYTARVIARRPADKNMTYGYARAEIVAALVNYTTLILVGLYLVYEGILRFFSPQNIDGWLVVVIAGIALVVDLITALLTKRLSLQSLNIRAAFLHNLADALGSVAVIFAGTLILLYGWTFVDPLITLLIAGYILWQSFAEIRPVIRILMLGSPTNIELDHLFDEICSIEGIASIHHVHLWQMQEHEKSFDAHLVIDEGAWTTADEIKDQAKSLLLEKFGITHSTLELECRVHTCPAPAIIGH